MPKKMGEGGYNKAFITPMNVHPGTKGQPDPMNVPEQHPRDPLGVVPSVRNARRDDGQTNSKRGK